MLSLNICLLPLELARLFVLLRGFTNCRPTLLRWQVPRQDERIGVLHADEGAGPRSIRVDFASSVNEVKMTALQYLGVVRSRWTCRSPLCRVTSLFWASRPTMNITFWFQHGMSSICPRDTSRQLIENILRKASHGENIYSAWENVRGIWLLLPPPTLSIPFPRRLSQAVHRAGAFLDSTVHGLVLVALRPSF